MLTQTSIFTPSTLCPRDRRSLPTWMKVVALCSLAACGERADAGDAEGTTPTARADTESAPELEDESAAPTEEAAAAPTAEARPNILLIMADDLGYSDIAAFGGEISTPNLDRLAKSGRLLTSHHSGQTCSPTRAMLLSGADSHLVGLGSMAENILPEQRGKPGYEGVLNNRALSVAQLLQDSGYHTYIAGKWHLGNKETESPKAWGFESSFVLTQGSSSHFSPTETRFLNGANFPSVGFRENGKTASVPKTFYSTDFYTDKLLAYLKQNEQDGKPFFAFAAYTSPHAPLQAPAAYIDRYKGRYDVGYERIREARIARQKELGIIPADFVASPRLPSTAATPDWDRLSADQKKFEARKMEVYAAMVENLDNNIGRILTYLEQTGKYDNTFIFFQSDNGADGNDVGVLNDDNSYANIGRINSNLGQGRRWAEVSATPFRSWKSHPAEGGLSVPAIAHLPRQKGAAQPFVGLTHILDLAPTFLELAQTQAPTSSYKGRAIEPMTGLSILSGLSGQTERVHPPTSVLAEELYGRRSVRRDNWKILFSDSPSGANRWQLYDLGTDRAERNDLAQTRPEILQELQAEWDRYAERVGVILPKSNPFPETF